MQYYVYEVLGKDKELLYIGKGTDKRHLSHLSGTSSNKSINRYYFSNGEGECLSANILKYFDNEEEALGCEKLYIQTLKPKFNFIHSEKERVLYNNFTDWSKQYYEFYKDQDTDGMNELRQMKSEYSDIVDVIGIVEIKKTGFHKTKSKAKYRKMLGIKGVASSKAKAHKHLKVKEGKFYTYSEIKDKIQECYDKIGLSCTAKATDIKQIYNVKRTTRGGVEGFLIGGKI